MKVLVSVASFALRQFSVSRALLLCLLVLGISGQAFAQNATVVGTITDPSGAAVANATITITHTETSQAYHLISNSDGQYVAPDLPIGHYNLKVEASGFKAAEQKGVVLQVGDRTRLDFQMVVGGASETVTVEANEVRVQTDSGELSNVITDQQVTNAAGVQALGSNPFTVSDLSYVWVVCDVYENDLNSVRVGDSADVTLTHIPTPGLSGGSATSERCSIPTSAPPRCASK